GRLCCDAGDEQGGPTRPLAAGLSAAGGVTKRFIVAEGVKPAGAGTTCFKPAERGEHAGSVRREFVVPALPREPVGIFLQRRQQAFLFGGADEFKTPVVLL